MCVNKLSQDAPVLEKHKYFVKQVTFITALLLAVAPIPCRILEFRTDPVIQYNTIQ